MSSRVLVRIKLDGRSVQRLCRQKLIRPRLIHANRPLICLDNPFLQSFQMSLGLNDFRFGLLQFVSCLTDDCCLSAGEPILAFLPFTV